MLKTVSSITNAIGALNYKGTWNASTNTPTIVSSTGTKGDYYVVSVAGTTAIDGISNWGVGDWIVFNGAAWQRVEGGADLNGVNVSFTGTASGPTYETSNATAGLTITDNDITADGTDTDIDIDITPKGTGEVNLPKVDIDGGTIDGVSLGSASAITSATFGGLLSSQVVTSGSGNAAHLAYRQIVELSTLEPNTLYQYYVTIDPTDAYLAIGFLSYSASANILIPLITGGTAFSPTSSVSEVRINAGWLEYQQKSGGTQLVRWRVARLFRGR